RLNGKSKPALWFLRLGLHAGFLRCATGLMQILCRMKLALLGGGTIARLVLSHLRTGGLPGVEVLAICGRSSTSPSASLAREFSIRSVLGTRELVGTAPEVVLEAASHEAVREHLVALLEAGISVIVLSAGALADDG